MVAIGIDLGTQWVTTAALVEGRPQLLGEPLPSLATLHRELVVGDVARVCAEHLPHATVDDVVRILGRRFHHPEVAWLRQLRPAAIVPAGNGDAWLRLAEREVAPEEVAAALLRRARAMAKEALARRVDEAVITVPGFAGQAQRAAVLTAAHLAGFERVRLVSAPACAALGANVDGDGPFTFLDIGAGSFDVLVAHREPSGWQANAVAGDTLLGLRDFDQRLVEHFMDAIWRHHGVRASADPRVLAELQRIARRVRRELDRSPVSGPVVAPRLLAQGGRLRDFRQGPIAQDTYRALVAEELARLAAPCAWALEDAGLGTDDLEAVVLCGGAAHSRLVVEHVERLFRRPVHRVTDRTAVARGAAMVAAARGPVPVRDVTPHSLGLRGRAGHMQRVLRRNLLLPAWDETKVQIDAGHSGAPLLLEVYEGEGDEVRNNEYVGRFVVDAPPGPHLRVELHVDDNGLVEGRLSSAQRVVPLELRPVGGLSPREADALRAEMPPSRPVPRPRGTAPHRDPWAPRMSDRP